MLIKQISVFVENKSGRLAEITKILAENNIDISAVSISDTTDFGILRMIVNKPEEAEEVLQKAGLTVSCTAVIAISVKNKPGGLAEALDLLANKGIGIEYMYAIGKKTEEALIILRVEDADKAVNLLLSYNIKVLPSDSVYSL